MTPVEGCRHCGLTYREHVYRWTADAAWHPWTEPTKNQVAERMRERLEVRKP